MTQAIEFTEEEKQFIKGAQSELARNGSDMMLIHLGKTVLA